jgi:arylamine N-acetyltransferase
VAESASAAREFYDEHGFAVVRDVVDQETCQKLVTETEKIKRASAEQLGVDYEAYRKEISQHRDLHLKREEGVDCFMEVLRVVAEKVVLPLTGWSGATLFHDHVINKPQNGCNEAIPGHQDSMFWPVDRPGISAWLALEPIREYGGCLEVVDGTHKSTCDDPIDFMAVEVPFAEKFPGKLEWRLPVEAGSLVLLHSLTYHRSSPKIDKLGDRFVYLMLLVPMSSLWRPDLVDWHPINQHLLDAGKRPQQDRLSDEPRRHPSFWLSADKPECHDEPAEALHQGTRSGNDLQEGITMYNASKKTTAQLRSILGISESVPGSELLKDGRATYSELFEVLVKTGVCQSDQKDELTGILERLKTCFYAYDSIKARNVFNGAFADWWRFAGERWETRCALAKLESEHVAKYMDRIGVPTERDGQPRKPDLLFLSDIVKATLLNVPFNNFSMILARPRVRPTRTQIVDLMVGGRGGLCNVMNPFLFMLLRSLGFAVELLSCDVHGLGPEGPLRDVHLSLVVTLGDDHRWWVDEERYWVDVGNGYPYLRPLSIDDAITGQGDVITHPFLDVRLMRRANTIEVQHFQDGHWTANNSFELEGSREDQIKPKTAKWTAFDLLHMHHYAVPATSTPLCGSTFGRRATIS